MGINPRFILSILIEFGPLGLFFIGYELRGFFFAATLLVVAVLLSLVGGYLHNRRFTRFPFFVGMFIIFLGGATVVTENPIWLKLEFTLYNAIFGFALLVGVAYGKPLLKFFFYDTFSLTQRGWLALSLRWGIWMVFIALSNEIVRRFYPTSVWVDYRMLAAIAGLLFAASQATLTRKERASDATHWGLRR